MTRLFLLSWTLAGLLTLNITLRPDPNGSDAAPPPASDSLNVIEHLRTRCELPAGTLVFVIRAPEVTP